MVQFLWISVVLVAALVVGTNATCAGTNNTTSQKCCGQNEEWKPCGACDSTCSKDIACTLECKSPGSCGCKDGYVRTDDSRKICILKNKCPKPPVCKKNEKFYPCGACDSTCSRAIACPLVCRPPGSCGCKEGYVRTDDSKKICIPKNKCPKIPACGKNETFYPCGACDSTCSKDIACTLECKLQGSCGCKEGYVRTDDSKKMCIQKNECPTTPVCGKNETFYPCGACDQGCNYAVRCDTSCRKGACGCKSGYVRNNGDCILLESCPKTDPCGENEMFYPCGACDRGCDYLVKCDKSCRKGSCGCKPDYVRYNGKCIPLKSCPKPQQCGRNETFYPCGSCDQGCDYAVECTLECRKGACGCKSNYLRSNGLCVLSSDCPKALTCGPNEEVKQCGACDSTCDEDIFCTEDCRQPECGCIKDHVRNKDKKCVLESECPCDCVS